MTSKHPEHLSERQIPRASLIVRGLVQEHGYMPERDERPDRCRAAILNPEGTKVLTILRHKPGRDPYSVFPGGGIEDQDIDALAGILRELHEELAIDGRDIDFDPTVIRSEDEFGVQFYYLGVAPYEFEDLSIHGPEADRDIRVSGTYTPTWLALKSLGTANLLPQDVTTLLQEQYRRVSAPLE